MLTIACPDGWIETGDVSTFFRSGVLFSISHAFSDRPQWVQHRERISIKPGETGEQAYQRISGQSLPPRHVVLMRDM